MTLTKDQKKELLENLKGLFENSGASVASDYSGLDTNEITELRKTMNGLGINLLVTKNTIVKKALGQLNLKLEEDILDKPLMFAFGKDEIEVCKQLNEFAKLHENLKILGGILNNKSVDIAKIKSLALLPSREELQSKLVGILAAPSYGLVNVLHANIRGLISVLSQYNSKLKIKS